MEHAVGRQEMGSLETPEDVRASIHDAARRAAQLRELGYEICFHSATEAGTLTIELRAARSGRLLRTLTAQEAIDLALGTSRRLLAA